MDTNDDTVGGERVETLQGVGGETRLALLAVGQHRCVDAHQPIDRLRPRLIDQSFDVVVAEFSCGELCQSIDQVLRAGECCRSVPWEWSWTSSVYGGGRLGHQSQHLMIGPSTAQDGDRVCCAGSG